MSDDDFEALSEDEQAGLGPAAVLLAGFEAAEETPISQLLSGAGAPEHALIRCRVSMLDQTLHDALAEPAPGELARADQLPRVLILSGLSNRQLHAVIDGFADTGLRRPVWASATENSLQMTLKALLTHLLAEQQAAMERPPTV